MLVATTIGMVAGSKVSAGNEKKEPIVVHDLNEANQAIDAGYTAVWVDALCLRDYKKLSERRKSMISGFDSDTKEQLKIVTMVEPKIKVLLVPVPVVNKCRYLDEINAFARRNEIRALVVEVNENASSLRDIARHIDQTDVLFMVNSEKLYGTEQMRYWYALTSKYRIPILGAWNDEQLRQGASAGVIENKDLMEECKKAQFASQKSTGRWLNEPCAIQGELRSNARVMSNLGITLATQ